MRRLIKAALLGASALLVATPALAWTVQPTPPTGEAASRFNDPDAALESTGSAMRDSVVSNSLGAQGGGAFAGGASTPYGYSSQSYGSQSYGSGAFTVTSQTYNGGGPYGFGSAGAYGAPVLPLWAPRRH